MSLSWKGTTENLSSQGLQDGSKKNLVLLRLSQMMARELEWVQYPFAPTFNHEAGLPLKSPYSTRRPPVAPMLEWRNGFDGDASKTCLGIRRKASASMAIEMTSLQVALVTNLTPPWSENWTSQRPSLSLNAPTASWCNLPYGQQRITYLTLLFVS